MRKRLSTEFSGIAVSRQTERSIQRKICQFLGKEFDYFSDELEEKALYEEEPCSVVACFGDDECYYYVVAETILDGNIRFSVNDTDHNGFLAFWASHLSGELKKVHIYVEDIRFVHKVLNLLSQSSWVG